MKKILLTLTLVAGVLACGDGVKNPPPDPTPGPVPEPTAVVTPCESTGVGTGSRATWSGDCQASDTCRDGGDGFFYGSSCRTR